MLITFRRAAAALAALASIALAAEASAQPAMEAEIAIRADQPGPQINRNIYGQFAEHLGRGIYEGIWVGTNSRIPNTRGFRNDVLEALRALDVPVLRWPGGCFADIYHWRDGIGPRNRRPIRLNALWGGVEESNQFGTHEFFELAELLGADPYLNINMGTGTPQEMMDWLEYITSDSNSALANERRRNGRAEPWKLPYITIGNETWGCGGNMRPEYYADLYAQYATFIKTPADNTPLRVASGGHGDLQSWTEALMTHPTAPPFFDAISLHHYTLPTGSWTGAKGAAIGFPETEWASTMMRTLRMEDILTSHGAIMDAADPDKRVGLYVDEWGTWYDAEPGDNDAFLYQQNTLRDAIVAALNLNIFHAHADRVHMTNIAQMVNVLQAMILTDGPRMVMTPTYHVFEMYRPFQDATSLPVTVSAPAYVNGEISLASVSASAARTEDGALVLALVNLNPNAAALVTTRIEGAAPTRVDGRILTAPAMDAHNTFDAPAQLQPQPFANVQIDGETLTLLLPEKSVLVLTLR